MALTKAQTRALVRQLIDDPAGKLWNDSNLDLLIEAALDELWADLLDSFPFLRSTESAALTPVTPGTINLDTALVRFYRIQQVVRSGGLLSPCDQKDILFYGSTLVGGQTGTWAVYGSLLYMFPFDVTAASVFVRYNSRPPVFASLLDTDPVIWPDGHHLAYVYDIASRALEKGNREDSTQFGRRAEASLFRLKAFLRKQYVGPNPTPWSPMDSIDFGSVT